MEKQIEKLLSNSVLEEAASRFGFRSTDLDLISDFENYVYASKAGTLPGILRITHSSHRKLEEILGEFDWMDYLFVQGISIPKRLRSVNGSLVEIIAAGDSHFLVSAFQKLPGRNIIEAYECTPENYQKWGQLLGRMHALTKDFVPSQPSYKRAEWYEDDLICYADRYIPGQAVIIDKIHKLVCDLEALPKDRNTYGLIHSDLTDVNYFICDGRLMVFDFDDCLYHWFAYDIAVILYENLDWLPHGAMNKDEFVRYFWKYFMQGYTQENSIDPFWIDQLDRFCKLREIYLYLVFHKKWDLENLSAHQRRDLEEFRHNIENDISYLNHVSLQEKS